MIDLIHNKHSLTLRNPIMLAAGVAGFGLEYARTIDFEQLGAIVTNPITWRPRRAANGIRVSCGMAVSLSIPASPILACPL